MNIRPVTLVGKRVRLEPLGLHHAPSLTKYGTDVRIWKYMVFKPITNLEEMRAWIEELLRRQANGTDLPFAVIDLASEEAIGVTRYLDIRPEHRSLEIGGTWYAIAYQGSGVNVDAKYLLLKHAFEELNCVRVQLKTDARNLRSQRAIEKIGATKEGVLRNHMILPDGTVRDSVIYSIIDSEWPQVKNQLEARLAQSAMDQ